ncbi:RNaseH domain-containing protein [Streptomyces spororaveus]|uniref:RNaseH domain-containing protein n=1 Tax=Streptomyces spororaveus TaxID=284039 RepID=UPI0037A1F6F3
MADEDQSPYTEYLAFRITKDVVQDSTVHVRDIGADGRTQWRNFRNAYKQRTKKSEAQPPHSIVPITLRAMTGGYVWLDRDTGLLVSRDPISDTTVQRVFSYLHGLSMGRKIHEIDPNMPPRLAEMYAAAAQEERLIADYLDRTPEGQPNAPNWVYNTITWDLSRRLSTLPFISGGNEYHLMPDTTGGLVAWEDVWRDADGAKAVKEHQELERIRYAFARMRLSMKTARDINDPLLLVSASASRARWNMDFTRNVLVRQASPTRPVMEVGLDGRGRARGVSRMALETLAAMSLGESALHQIDARIGAENKAREAEETIADLGPDQNLRPIVSKNYGFPVGAGVGTQFLRDAYDWVHGFLGEDSRPLASIPVKRKAVRGAPKETSDAYVMPPGNVLRSLDAIGAERLRVLCLWSSDPIRLRMIATLASAYGLDPDADPVDGKRWELHAGRVFAEFRHVPDLLEHGDFTARKKAAEGIFSLEVEPGEILGVLAETEYGDGKEGRPKPPEGDQDAKHQVRTILGAKGIVSQFINNARPAAKSKAKKSKDGAEKKAVDYEVRASLIDLYRSLGFIDERFDYRAFGAPIGPYQPTELAHCGIHVRRQAKQKGDPGAKISIAATTLKPPTRRSGAWTLHGWDVLTGRWRPYHQAVAAFHSRPLLKGTLTEADDSPEENAKVALVLDQALEDLHHYLGGIAYTVTVDGVACRRLWPGLHNNKGGQTPPPRTAWTPGATRAAKYRPAAVIRLNKSMSEVGRPVRMIHWRKGEREEAITTTLLNRLPTDQEDGRSWLLVNMTHQHDGNGHYRKGEHKTRWDARPPVEKVNKDEIGPNYYSMTALEIVTLECPSEMWEPLARLTWSLCDIAMAWQHRTKYPVPLHAALQMDQDHPHYRRTLADSDGEPVTDPATEGPETAADENEDEFFELV